MTMKESEQICGPLSKPSKMPCYGYSIPAVRCKIGAKMRNIKGSVCSKCYALKGRYVFKIVANAMEKRFLSLKNPLWVTAISNLILLKEKSGFFRWHDSGDLQGVWHLKKIVEIAEKLPQIKFWLPTREYKIVKEYLDTHHSFPNNLTVRLSGLWLDGSFPTVLQNPYGLPVSGACKTNFNCPSFKQNGKCLSCRHCWDKRTKIIYKQH